MPWFFDKLPPKIHTDLSVDMHERVYYFVLQEGFVKSIGLLVFRFKILHFVAPKMSSIGAKWVNTEADNEYP